MLVTLALLYVARRVHAVRTGRRELAADPDTAEDVAHRGFSVMLAVLEFLGAIAFLLALLVFYAPPSSSRAPWPPSGSTIPTSSRSTSTRTRTAPTTGGPASRRAQPRLDEGGGFHAAYITDHYTGRGWTTRHPPTRPARAATVMLSGMEARLRDRHVNLLGDRDRYLFALDSTRHHSTRARSRPRGSGGRRR